MAKRNRYIDIPGAAKLSGAPSVKGGQAKKSLHIATKITLVLAAITLVLLLFVAFGGGGVSRYIHWYWVSWLLASLFAMEMGVLLLLGARRIAKSNWARLGLTCVMVLVLTTVAASGYAMTTMFYEYGEVPIGYFTSPDGERIVVMRSGNSNKEMNPDGTVPHVYTAYQMLNRWFYLSQSCDEIYANDDDNPDCTVEWLEGGNARLYLPDYVGKAHSETEIVVYDLDNLETSIAQKDAEMAQKRLTATPAPTDSPEDLAPKASADPFAYSASDPAPTAEPAVTTAPAD